MKIPSLTEKSWTTAEVNAADAFTSAMGEAGYEQFAKGSGCGRLMHCIRAALMAAQDEQAFVLISPNGHAITLSVASTPDGVWESMRELTSLTEDALRERGWRLGILRGTVEPL